MDKTTIDTPRPTKIKDDDMKNDKIKKDNNENRETKRKTNDNLGESSKPKKAKLTKPFHELLSGVTLVISGIQNPDRGILRTMALSMGAKYKPDWDSTCTHLICAFPNTPKFNQVKGKGKIVKKSWLETCHSQRKRLPWRRFALDKADLNKDESEDEIYELVDLPSTSNNAIAIQNNSRISDDDDCKAEGSDTEERIAKILAKKKEDKQKKEIKNPTKKRDESPFKKKAETSPKTRVDTPPKPKKDEPAPLQISTDDDLTDEESLNGPINSKNEKTNTGSPKTKQARNNQVETSPKREMRKTGDDDDDDETDEESLNVPNKYNKENISNGSTRVQTPLAKKTSPKLKKEVVMDVSDDDETDEESLNIPTNSKNSMDRVDNSKRLSNSQTNAYTVDTDEEVEFLSNFQNERTMDIFHDENFYVDESFDPNTYRKLTKYIKAYHGNCTDDITSNVDIIITTKENSKTLKEVNKQAKCLDQEWILQTHNKHKWIPLNNYLF
ncbi:unnamed protein product [Diabrotica balteata]|uniref:BRCT domain-containing protein n=2 Tax=Diabrotica balteata TaxID=107213 RepID=A0A9N9XA90_DIABA|nr:unnamed protein product [Diabrotica balteata]